MKKYNIFISSSPLQLLNSIEACHHFKTKNNLLLIINNNDKNTTQQMKKLLEVFQWDEIREISLPQTNIERIGFVNYINKNLNFLKESILEKVFVGEYRSPHITHIINYLTKTNIYLVDDGLAVLNYDDSNIKTFKQKTRKNIYTLFLYKLNPIDFKFFTIFDILQKNIIKNQYTYIKQFMAKKEVEQTVYFIGQPLVELSIINEADYRSELKKVIDSHVDKEFVFILHRRQNENFIKALAIEFGFKYKKFNQLIELEMLQSLTIPAEFVTFYSTAIVTLSKLINKSSYKAYKINLNNININLSNIEKCYHEFNNNGIKVIES